MKQVFQFGIVAAAILAFADAGYTGDAPTYALALSGSTSFEGEEGSAVDISGSYDVTLEQTGDDGHPGAQGWSLSVASTGAVSVASITDAGTVAADVSDGGIRNTGFAVNETTADGAAGSDCEGLSGGVQAIVLSFVMPITLATDGPQLIAVVGTSGECTAPAAETSEDVGTVGFANGCQGSGQPVANNVTWSGNTIQPSLSTATVSCAGVVPLVSCPEDGNGLQVLFEDVALSGSEVAGSSDDPATASVCVDEGAVGSTTLYAGIQSSGLDSGVQGWSLSVAVCDGGSASITGVTDLGTDAADVNDGGLRNTGFAVAETTDGAAAGSACDGLNGAVQAIVLSFVMPITLPTDGTNRVLCIDLGADGAQPAGVDEDGDGCADEAAYSATLQWKDGCQGSGQPVNNVATIAGNTETFDCCQSVTVSFFSVTVPPTNNAASCDPNDDGKADLADAIWIINDLIRGGPDTACEASIDCNGDDLNDISDALYIAQGLFGLGEAPSVACNEVSSEVCETGSSACAE